MINSKKIVTALALCFMANQAFAETDEMESMEEKSDSKGWQILAGNDDDFVFEPTISVMLGAADATDIEGDTLLSWGLEASFNCPLLQPPTNKIRQQVSYFNYTDGDNSIISFEINPHYIVDLSPNFWLGGGPGVGYVRADVDGKTANMPAAQLGLSFHYNMESIFIGGEARYQVTTEDDIGDQTDTGANNWRAALKLGYSF